MDYRPSRIEPAARLYRRIARLDRRQQLHLSRHRAHRRAGLAAKAHDPRRHRAHCRLALAEPLGDGPRMKVAVLGLWHLGTVTAACVAGAGIPTIGIDDDADVVTRLGNGEPPLYEPGLAE